MYWWLPENGDLIETHGTVDEALYFKTLSAQAFSEGWCPVCFMAGKMTKLMVIPVGLGWSNQRKSYSCEACDSRGIFSQLTLQLILKWLRSEELGLL